MDVDLRHFRAFAAVARERSFTRAAERLLITQPALTRTIQQLEAALQVRLVDRTSRHVELTEAGTDFLEHAERVLGAVEQALAAARQQATVRLGFSWLMPDPWAQDTMAGFARATAHAVRPVRCDDPLARRHQRLPRDRDAPQQPPRRPLHPPGQRPAQPGRPRRHPA
jgi:regulatory helix-turn-helix LysR family protein